MHLYTHFGQGQSGIFHLDDCIDDLVGTSNVGPCIVLFLYDPKKHNCFAIHIDDRISFAAIRVQVLTFVANHKCTTHLKGYLIGGWDCFKDTEPNVTPLLAMLQKLAIKKIDTSNLYQKHGSITDVDRIHYYEAIVLNLRTGKLTLVHRPGIALCPSFDRYARSKKDCFKYLQNAIPLSDSINSLVGSQTDFIITQFHQDIVSANNATPIIEAKNFSKDAAFWIFEFKKHATSGDALKTIESLYNSFINPCTLIEQSQLKTALHCACLGFKDNIQEYEREVIVLLLLLHGQRDLADNNGKTALSYIRDVFFRKKCQELLKLIQSHKTSEGINYAFVKQYHMVTARLVNDIIQYRVGSKVVQNKIHDTLAEYFKQLSNITTPEQKISAKACLLLSYLLVFLLYMLCYRNNNHVASRYTAF